MQIHKDLITKIQKKKTVIAVIGLGYVGLPLASLIGRKGFKTYGIDIDKNKINLLKKSSSYIRHIENKNLKKIINKKFFPINNHSIIRKVDIIILCLPTPVNKNKSPDLSYIKNNT